MDDLLWIAPALIAGIAAARVGLPPMVGYLLCGFVLNFSGVYSHDRLTSIGDLGVTLLLFTIGLKLDLRSLLRPVIWAGTTLHTVIVIAVIGTLLYWMSLAGIQAFAGIDIGTAMLIGFALSFSSTVFAVKTLEDKGEYQSKYGQVAIGVLIMQDIFAVVFLAASTGKLPSVWALGLLLLVPMRYLLMQLLNRAGHSGELQILYGIALALGGYALFEAVDVKGDLGALIIGAMLASHPLAGDVSKRLLGFKDLLLVGFFLSIGMSGDLTVSAVLIALLLAVLVVFKVALFFVLFTRFKLRARTATLSSLTLANYSEFGLIVGAIAVSNAWLTEDWLVTIALALTITIIVAAPFNMIANRLYDRLRATASRFETKSLLPEDEPVDLGDAKIAVIGMGRLGTGVYKHLAPDYGNILIGIDIDPDIIDAHKAAGRNVVLADVTDDYLWENTDTTNLEVGILALHDHQGNLGFFNHVRERNQGAKVFAVARHEDEVAELVDAGAAAAWNMYSEAGVGLASEVISYYKNRDNS
ncbi:MAG: potassium transporter Kef [Gammaproteobacteria bacterium]|jgi:predicted Kef-type K+ transport protein|nr:potassium transporter Kef [Gammaproteobacteria bacterium]